MAPYHRNLTAERQVARISVYREHVLKRKHEHLISTSCSGLHSNVFQFLKWISNDINSVVTRTFPSSMLNSTSPSFPSSGSFALKVVTGIFVWRLFRLIGSISARLHRANRVKLPLLKESSLPNQNNEVQVNLCW